MAASWRFYVQQATDPISNPIAGEFFSNETVGDVTQALIREGLQNTLDARNKKPDGSREPACVRIFLSDAAGALPARRARRWFGSLWPHLIAPGNGLRNQPADDEPCPFLVFEDFGTIGLTGDPEAHEVSPGITNHFLNFFRAEGHSDKGDQDRGSWGVGKTVFPRASRISSILGLTVRSDDDKQLLLGHSILKYHRVNGTSHKSHGYFGLPREDGFMLATGDASTLAEFQADFHISRRCESGLSIVVPWYETDGDDVLNREKVTLAVLRGFFYPILMGHLSVTIATPGGEVTMDASSIIRRVESMGGNVAAELLPVITLAEWAQTRIPTEFMELGAPDPEIKQSWSRDLVPAEVIKEVRAGLAQRQRLALRVPMAVQPRNSGAQPTFFHVFLEHSDEDSEKPVFIRDELIISDVKSPRVQQVRALVIVENGPLATLLRDAETPAHTQWNQDTSNFKNKYKFGTGAITFVRLSVSELLRVVNQADQQPDPAITVDFFSIPASSDEDNVAGRRRKPKPKPGPGPDTIPPPPPPPRPRRFRIDKLMGGFVIRAGDAQAPIPSLIDVRVAYDVRRGNPLRKYDEADFDLGSLPIVHDAGDGGVDVLTAAGNQMVIAVKRPGFRLEVTGFDPDRDLYVRAEVKEESDVD